MVKFSVIFAIVAFTGIGLATPVDKPLALEPPGPSIQRFSNETRPLCTAHGNANSINNGLRDKRYRWKNFNVQPDRAYDSDERQAINDAMYQLSQVLPCVSFGIWPPNSRPSGDYIYIKKGRNNGCDSYLGRIGGKQEMNLQSPGCMSIGTIMHEMMHALGIDHEHSRADRDDFITINYDNIEKGCEFNFEKVNDKEYSTFGVPYNQNSIMHYDNLACSRNGRPTIVAKNGQPVGLDDNDLKDTDIQKLKRMYEC